MSGVIFGHDLPARDIEGLGDYVTDVTRKLVYVILGQWFVTTTVERKWPASMVIPRDDFPPSHLLKRSDVWSSNYAQALDGPIFKATFPCNPVTESYQSSGHWCLPLKHPGIIAQGKPNHESSDHQWQISDHILLLKMTTDRGRRAPIGWSPIASPFPSQDMA
jgi:hypothetical protein